MTAHSVPPPARRRQDALIGAEVEVPCVDGRTRRYVELDHAASTPALAGVWDAVEAFLPWYSSVHRGSGRKSQVATAAYEHARGDVAAFVGARDDDVVVFVGNTTVAINVLAAALPAGTRVLATEAEHHANMLPWRRQDAWPLPLAASAGELLERCERALRAARPRGRRRARRRRDDRRAEPMIRHGATPAAVAGGLALWLASTDREFSARSRAAPSTRTTRSIPNDLRRSISMYPIPFRRGARAAAALGAAFALAAIAEPAAADIEVSVVDGNFGTGASGRVLRIVEERDLLANEPMGVRVTPASGGRVLVADGPGKVTAGAGCTLLSTGDARCAGGLDGILMQGTTRDDVLDNDTAVTSRLEGRTGNDRLDGGDGNDHLEGAEGNDTLIGGLGAGDRIIYSGSPTPVAVTLGDGFANDGGTGERDNPVGVENVVGSRFADQIAGTNEANVLEGRTGNDRLQGLGGDDTFDEGDALNGSDDLSGGDGIDRVVYLGRSVGVNVNLDDQPGDGSVNDDGSARDNARDIENVVGTDRPDRLTGDGDANVLDGRGGGDDLEGRGGDDTLLGGGGDDGIVGQDGDDTASGGDGADTIAGFAGRDTLRGDAGADSLDGGLADDILEGGNDNDRLAGADGADQLLGEGGSDELSGNGGGDLLHGGGDVDAIPFDYASGGDVRVTVDSTREVDLKTPGDDGSASDGPAGQRDTVIAVETIRAGAGNDRIEGSGGSETFFGGPGDDTLIGNGGGDELHGDNQPGVPFLPGEQPGIDELDGGQGLDRLFTKDGLIDEIRCGIDLDLDGLPLPDFAQSQDELSADLVDVLTPHPDSRLDECDKLDAEAVDERHGARILSEALQIDRRYRARIALRCPAETLTDGCAGRLTVAAVGKPKLLAAVPYRLANGKRGKVRLQLSRRAARRLLKHKAAIVKATEQDRSGRPKITSKLLRLKQRAPHRRQ